MLGLLAPVIGYVGGGNTTITNMSTFNENRGNAEGYDSWHDFARL